MRTILVLGLATLVATQLGLWLVSELVGRSVTAMVSDYRMLEPFFTGVILSKRSLLIVGTVLWIVSAFVMWRPSSGNPRRVALWIMSATFYCVITSLVVVVACILPWLPRK